MGDPLNVRIARVWAKCRGVFIGGSVVLGAFALVSAALWLRDDIVGFVSPDSVRYGGGKVYLVQADRRAIFVFHSRDNAGFACPEPSPDVRAAVDRALKTLTDAQLTAAKEQGTGGAKVSFEATQKLVTESLMERTQGLQVLRDMLFQACLANVRGDMGGLQYVDFVTKTLPRLTTSLIAAELVTRHETEKGPAKMSGQDLQVFLNFLVLNN